MADPISVLGGLMADPISVVRTLERDSGHPGGPGRYPSPYVRSPMAVSLRLL